MFMWRDGSVEDELPFERAPFLRRDHLPVHVADGVQRPVELFLPEFEEAVHFGEIRGQIIVLPDIGLENQRMVRQAIKIWAVVRP